MTPRRRKWFVTVACGLGCIAALVLASFWYNAAAADEDGPLWTLEDLRRVRGPRDLWDFITGESGRQRRVITWLTRSVELDLDRSVHSLELRHLLQAEAIAFNLWGRTSPAEWSLEETQLRAILWMADLGARRYGEPTGIGSTVVVANGIVSMAMRSKLCTSAEKQ
jgi:hypothetical protein